MGYSKRKYRIWYEKNKNILKLKSKAYRSKPEVKERMKKYLHDYNLKNKELLRDKFLSRYSKNREAFLLNRRNWREKNINKVKKYAKEWRTKNKERVKIYAKKHFLKNRESIKIAQYKYRMKNPIKFRLYRKVRLANKKSQIKIDLQKLQVVYEENIKENGTLTCYLCNQQILFSQDSLDHKIPISRGGTNNVENLEISHSACNFKKGNKTFYEFIDWLKKVEPSTTILTRS